MTKQGNKPVFERRLGNVRLVVFENESNGRAYFNVAMTRSYKDGNEWREVNTFNGLHDLALLKELIGQAAGFLALQESADKVAVEQV